MNIVVCAKAIPDPASAGKIDANTKTLDRSAKLVLDDTDRYGIELALQLNEKAAGGTVTIVSMSPLGDGSALRTALAMGADRVIHVVDESVVGSDSLSTAKVLHSAIVRDDVDLVIAGTESTDGYSGIMPAQLSQLLDWPLMSFAKEVVIDDNALKIVRQTDVGVDRVESELPAVLTVTAGVVTPRYPSFKGIMAAKSKPYEQLSIADLGLSSDDVGWNGARQQIVDVRDAPIREAGNKIVDEGNAHELIVEALVQRKVL